MGRADDLRAQHEAEIAVAELEDELQAAKQAGDVPADVKARLREARQTFRKLRDGGPLAEGDGVAQPAAIATNASVRKPGGGK